MHAVRNCSLCSNFSKVLWLSRVLNSPFPPCPDSGKFKVLIDTERQSFNLLTLRAFLGPLLEEGTCSKYQQNSVKDSGITVGMLKIHCLVVLS